MVAQEVAKWTADQETHRKLCIFFLLLLNRRFHKSIMQLCLLGWILEQVYYCPAKKVIR